MRNAKQGRPVKLTYHDYYDKVLAGWIGKSLGGVIGAPFENHKLFGQVTIDTIWPAALAANDDLDIQVVWLEAMQERGLYLTSQDLAEFWQDRCWYNFCEYGFFLHNMERGIAPPLSGTWNNSFFEESEGCPIRSEIWGFVCPGNPRLAASYARLDGQLDHGGVSVEIEQFLSAAAAQAFVANDLDEVLRAGLSVIPANSAAALAVGEVRAICAKYPDVYDAWRMVIRRYGDRDASKAITNHALVLMALFLGELDFRKTMLVCVNSGWDTDCTAATAGALLGVMQGTKKLPSDWTAKLGNALICGIEVKHKHAPLVDFAAETCELGVEMNATRNKEIEISSAPPVVVRAEPEPRIFITVEYPELPVLWDRRTTPINIIVHNPTAQIFEGELCVRMPVEIECGTFLPALKIGAGKQHVAALQIRRKTPGAWLPDKNLFSAEVMSKMRVATTKLTFGLGGARQWLVYGPYWDMWDKTKNEVCPYRNDKIKTNPANIGYLDYYNHHVRFDAPYLDESRLVREDIPEELPLALESGDDVVTGQKIGGFNGQACYYFTRTIRSTKEIGDVGVILGRSGPCWMWLDGRLVGQWDTMRNWAPELLMDDALLDKWGNVMDGILKCDLTGQPQRMVIKFISLTDALSFSALFFGSGDPTHKRGVSFVVELEDLPSPIST